MRLGTTEIILIVVLALVLFGGGKIAGLGKVLGQSIKDFKKEIKESKEEDEAAALAKAQAQAQAEPPKPQNEGQEQPKA